MYQSNERLITIELLTPSVVIAGFSNSTPDCINLTEYKKALELERSIYIYKYKFIKNIYIGHKVIELFSNK